MMTCAELETGSKVEQALLQIDLFELFVAILAYRLLKKY